MISTAQTHAGEERPENEKFSNFLGAMLNAFSLSCFIQFW